MPRPDLELKPYGRRTFLAVVAGGVVSLLWGEQAWRAAQHALRPLARAVPPSVRAIAPSRGWRIYTVADTMPTFARAQWRLTIDGLVEQPLALTYEDLLALPAAEQVSTFHCVTGWTVTGVHWRGVRFRNLLAAAQPKRNARALQFISAERPYTDSLTLAQARLPDAMLAYEMDGKPLAREHGAPVRVVMPQMYGYKNVKWVERIEVVARAPNGFWEGLGYDRDAWVGRSNRG